VSPNGLPNVASALLVASFSVVFDRHLMGEFCLGREAAMGRVSVNALTLPRLQKALEAKEVFIIDQDENSDPVSDGKALALNATGNGLAVSC
jgi:hypothetical protein